MLCHANPLDWIIPATDLVIVQQIVTHYLMRLYTHEPYCWSFELAMGACMDNVHTEIHQMCHVLIRITLFPAETVGQVLEGVHGAASVCWLL